MKVIFDFDGTIFDTKSFKRELKEVFYLAGVDGQLYDKTYYNIQVVHGDKVFAKYDLDSQLRAIESSGKQIDLARLRELVNQFFQKLDYFVFADFFEVIERLERNDLYLVSFGGGELKDRKIFGSGVSQFFAEIKTGDDKSELVGELEFDSEKKAFAIDDKVDHLKMIAEVFPQIMLFHLKRPENGPGKETPEDILAVESLLGFKSYLK